MPDLAKWTRPDNYMGAEWPEYYVFLGRHRDSSTLTESNFECALEELGGTNETVQIVHEGHWAVGWVEWIAIHESDNVALAKAQEILDQLDEYPVLNEDEWSTREYEAMCNFWKSCSVSHRMELLEDTGISLFAARHDYIPRDDSCMLTERLQEIVNN